LSGPNEQIEGFVAGGPAEVDVLTIEDGFAPGSMTARKTGDVVESIVLPLVVAGDVGDDEQAGEREQRLFLKFAAGGLPDSLGSFDLARDDAPATFVDAAGTAEEDE